MQDTVYRAILNGTMQGIYSIKKWYNARILAYLQMVLLQNSTMQGGTMHCKDPCTYFHDLMEVVY